MISVAWLSCGLCAIGMNYRALVSKRNRLYDKIMIFVSCLLIGPLCIGATVADWVHGCRDSE